MAERKLGAKPDKAGEHSPYCAFRKDRDRLLALVSRDIRLVLIAVLVALAAPSAPALLSNLWGALTRTL